MNLLCTKSLFLSLMPMMSHIVWHCLVLTRPAWKLIWPTYHVRIEQPETGCLCLHTLNTGTLWPHHARHSNCPKQYYHWFNSRLLFHTFVKLWPHIGKLYNMKIFHLGLYADKISDVSCDEVRYTQKLGTVT
jgi:hypothetical protein